LSFFNEYQIGSWFLALIGCLLFENIQNLVVQ
jgi:hypothetical protein